MAAWLVTGPRRGPGRTLESCDDVLLRGEGLCDVSDQGLDVGDPGHLDGPRAVAGALRKGRHLPRCPSSVSPVAPRHFRSPRRSGILCGRRDTEVTFPDRKRTPGDLVRAAAPPWPSRGTPRLSGGLEAGPLGPRPCALHGRPRCVRSRSLVRVLPPPGFEALCYLRLLRPPSPPQWMSVLLWARPRRGGPG